MHFDTKGADKTRHATPDEAALLCTQIDDHPQAKLATISSAVQNDAVANMLGKNSEVAIGLKYESGGPVWVGGGTVGWEPDYWHKTNAVDE